VELKAGNESTTVAFATAGELEMPGARAAARAVVIHKGAEAWVYASDATRLSMDTAAGAGTWTYARPVDVLVRRGKKPAVSDGGTR
jgi:hypothetical protein